MADVDVVVVGAGPTGLMLAGDLAGHGVRTLLLERRPVPSVMAKAGGLAGQIMQLLHYRGELPRFRAAGVAVDLPPRFPFGGLHLDFSGLERSPMQAQLISQAALEEVLAERAVERGVEVRRGHEVVGLRQDDGSVTVEVRGPESSYELRAAYVVGCDGGRSRIRDLVGIGFEGSSLPEIERLASTTLPDGVTALADGSLDVRGVGRVPFGYTATEYGVFACHGGDGTLGVYTAEVEDRAYDDDVAMGVEELAASVKRVMGIDLPLGEPLRMTRFGYSAKQADTYRDGRVLLAGDAAHLFPAGGVAINAGMMDAAHLGWKLAAVLQGRAPDDLLDTYAEERRAAADRTLLHTRAQVALRRGHGATGDALRDLFRELTADEQPLRRLGALMAGTDVGGATLLTDEVLGVPHEDARFAGFLGTRPVLLVLGDRADRAEVAAAWGDSVEVVATELDNPPAEALLVYPDSTVAWAGDLDDVAGIESAVLA